MSDTLGEKVLLSTNIIINVKIIYIYIFLYRTHAHVRACSNIFIFFLYYFNVVFLVSVFMANKRDTSKILMSSNIKNYVR